MEKLNMQGESVKINGVNAMVNSFEPNEMAFIYISLKKNIVEARGMMEDSLNKEEYDDAKLILNMSKQITKKMEKTLKNLGMNPQDLANWE